MGLKYAGSANEEAFATLLHYCHMFTSLTVKSIAELAGKPTIECCLNVILISVSMVSAELSIFQFVTNTSFSDSNLPVKDLKHKFLGFIKKFWFRNLLQKSEFQHCLG